MSDYAAKKKKYKKIMGALDDYLYMLNYYMSQVEDGLPYIVPGMEGTCDYISKGAIQQLYYNKYCIVKEKTDSLMNDFRDAIAAVKSRREAAEIWYDHYSNLVEQEKLAAAAK